MYDELVLFQRFFFLFFCFCLFVCFVFDAVRSLRQSVSLMICSTSHRQRGVRLLLLMAGAVLACFIVLLLEPFFFFFFFFLHFMVYSVETVTEAF